MLKRISKINGIGLFYAPEGVSSPEFKEITLLYGENARGKSTLASILSSAAGNDASLIQARETIDQEISAEVQLEFQDRGSATYNAGKWNGDGSSLRIFDSEFIDRNVHSGSVIDVGHRRNLLDFAIGEKAVAARSRQSALTVAKKDLDSELKSVEAELFKHSGKTPIEEFLAYPKVDDVDLQIKSKTEELESVKARRAIANQECPKPCPVPTFNIDQFFEVLDRTLSSLHNAAEASVKEHLKRLDNPTARVWISDGQRYLPDENCPFCGQDIRELDLVKHYQSVFNEEYAALRRQVSSQEESASAIFTGCDPETFEGNILTAKRTFESWKQTGVTAPSPGATDFKLAKAYFQDFTAMLESFISSKREDLNWVPSKDQNRTLRGYFDNYNALIRTENSIISSANEAIRDYVEALGLLNENILQTELQRLGISKSRHIQEVVELTQKREKLTGEIAKNLSDASKARKDERSEMNDLLGNYAGTINDFLTKLHAPFRIKDATANFAGGPPGATYAIEIRKREAPLSGDKNSFRTALSESDKRTMAFAFFLASTLADTDLAKRTIVVDDPMSSLDRNRRENTIFLLGELFQKCKQLIVLAHDPKFLLQLRNQVSKLKKPRPDGSLHRVSLIELKLTPSLVDPKLEYYSQFDVCDLDAECESKYAKNYRIVCNFLEDPAKSHEEAARAIRPLLEGYLHRRFPTRLAKGSMFGTSIQDIVKADDSNPLASAKTDVGRLKRIAYFGNDAHHDTDSDYSPPIPSHTATVGFARECLDLIHGV
ncbi:AAA family ATPase [Glutamicibacter sp. AOP33-2CA-4]|uniref:AAA family ATPase n=1 Tax=Glutamicibacter sp. AOP33-2CA-4 TaxID=3457690 RepID=UPI004034E313